MATRHEPERFSSFVQAVAVCDELQQRENAALRAQVHDLTELLAGCDLCGLRDPHLMAVRDRAFRRDLASDQELLQLYRFERQQQQETLQPAMLETPTAPAFQEVTLVEESSACPPPLQPEGEALPHRVEALEAAVARLQSQLEAARLPMSEQRRPAPADMSQQQVDDAADESPSPPREVSGGDDTHQRAEAERLVAQEELCAIQEHCERATRTLREQLTAAQTSPDEQRERIAALEATVARLMTRNEALRREYGRYKAMVNQFASFAEQ